MPKVGVLARRSQARPWHFADELPMHGIRDAVRCRCFGMISKHDLDQAIRFRNLFEETFAFFAYFSAAVHLSDNAVFDLPAHWFGQHACDALHATQIDFAVRLAIAVENAAPSPGKMAAAWRIAGAKLHAVKFFSVIG